MTKFSFVYSRIEIKPIRWSTIFRRRNHMYTYASINPWTCWDNRQFFLKVFCYKIHQLILHSIVISCPTKLMTSSIRNHPSFKFWILHKTPIEAENRKKGNQQTQSTSFLHLNVITDLKDLRVLMGNKCSL